MSNFVVFHAGAINSSWPSKKEKKLILTRRIILLRNYDRKKDCYAPVKLQLMHQRQRATKWLFDSMSKFTPISSLNGMESF